MDTAELIKSPPRPTRQRHQPSETSRALMSDSEFPPLERRLGEIVPLICAVPGAGPPVIFLVGPWALFVLMLTGPFALLVVFVLAAVILVVIATAILVPPYLLIRQIHKRWTRPSERARTGRRQRTSQRPAESWPKRLHQRA